MATPAPSRDADSLVEEGRHLAERGDLAGAVAPLQRALAIRPGNEKARNLLGMALFRLKRYREAEEVYRDLVAANPQVHTLHMNLGLIYLKLDRLRESEAHLTKALSLSPRHEKTLLYLGLVNEKAGDTASALDCYEQAGASEHIAKLRGVSARSAVAAPPPRRAPSDLDTLRVRVPVGRGHEADDEDDGGTRDVDSVAAPVSSPPTAPAESGAGNFAQAGAMRLRLHSMASADAPGNVVFLSDGQGVRVGVEKTFFVPAGRAAALAGWFRSAHSPFSAKVLQVEGKGHVHLAASEGRRCFVLAGAFDELHVPPEAFLGASGGLRGAERFIGEHPFVSLSGEGFVAVAARSAPSLTALEPLPFQVPLSRLVAWASERPPEITARAPAFPAKDVVLRFVASGLAAMAEM